MKKCNRLLVFVEISHIHLEKLETSAFSLTIKRAVNTRLVAMKAGNGCYKLPLKNTKKDQEVEDDGCC